MEMSKIVAVIGQMNVDLIYKDIIFPMKVKKFSPLILRLNWAGGRWSFRSC